MQGVSKNKYALLVLDISIIFLCAAGFYHIVIKSTLPFDLEISNNNIAISINEGDKTGLKSGSIILAIDNFEFKDWEEVELYLDGKSIGDVVQLHLSKNGESHLVQVRLTSYYSLFDLLIIGIVGLIFISFAILVKFKAPENKSAKLFHFAALGLAMVIVMTPGYYNSQSFGFGHINRILWLFVYGLTPVLFIHFTYSFSQKKFKSIKHILWYFYMGSIINASILSFLFLNATINQSIVSLKNYVYFFDSFFRIFLITCIVIAISICIYAYRNASDREERKRLQWLLLGFFIGPFSFVVFWVVPIILTGSSIIPESFLLILLTSIPIAFSIAIVKYHLMNINLLIRRSVVYTMILAIIILFYVGISSLVTLFVIDINPAFPSVLTALAVVTLLQPVKNGIQKFVDKQFFRVEYDFREEQSNFLDDMKSVYDINSLTEMVVNRVDKLIPVEKIGYFELNREDGRVRLVANNGWDWLKGRSIRFEFENLKTDLSIPVAVDDRVEAGLNIESADIKVFRRWGMVLVFPVKSPTGVIHGFLVLGAKKSGVGFLKDDVDLLNAVVFAAALATDRIKLQEDLILEHLEAERLKELNEVKSLFVSSMVHELKRPLTGIKMFTELLQDKPNQIESSDKKYLSIIDGESGKLENLINNILDNAMIEKGIKNYEMKKIEINYLIRKCMLSIEYMFKMKNQQLEISLLKRNVFIIADEKAIESMLINLLTNASKYSSEHTTTKLTTSIIENQFLIVISDEGKGIAEKDLQNIFQPYFRIKEAGASNVDGTGLGLSIVNHIVDSHNGEIKVESEIGKGSKFTLCFPLLNE